MNKSQKWLLVVVAVVALGTGAWLSWERAGPGTGAAGERLIDFTLPDLEGQERSLSDWRGKLIVLNFWATWCPPCREEIPLFMEFQERYAGEGLQFIGVAIDKKQDVVDYRDSLFMNYPILLGADDTVALMADYGNRIGTLPFSVIISPDGNILQRKKGAYSREELEGLLSARLAGVRG